MEMFRFIKWQWNRFSFEEISIGIAILSSIVAGFISAGSGFVAVLLSIVLTFLFVGSFCGIFHNIRSQWRKYKRERDAEAQKIVDKLRGSRNGVGTNC